MKITVKRNALFKWSVLAAALLLCFGGGVLCAGLLGGGLAGSEGKNKTGSVNSVILLDVNPSISLVVNEKEKVVSARGLNEDGNSVLNGMDLANVDMTVAVNAVIGAMLQKGYLSDLQNAILISVENDDSKKADILQERISSIVEGVLRNCNLNGTVLSQSIHGTSDLEWMAQEYSISLGKAALIEEVRTQDPTLTVEKLAPLSITEIALISNSKDISPETVTQAGTASDKAYISRESAIDIAYASAGVNAESVTGTRAEFDIDNGIMVYEVEFYAGTVKYEYDVNAFTGQVVKYEKEEKPAVTNPISKPPADSKPSADYIGAQAAKEAALAHAGLTASQVTMMKAEFDYEHGIAVYEVEFEYGRYEYEYEIDALTGAVRKYDIDD